MLYSYFGENIHFIFNIFSGKIIKFPILSGYNEIGLMIKIYREMTKMLEEYELDFNKCIDLIAEKFNLTTNKVFVLYNRVVHIIKEYERNERRFF